MLKRIKTSQYNSDRHLKQSLSTNNNVLVNFIKIHDTISYIYCMYMSF